tara:strand:+ start:3478 stop:4266 length:789 start_codon:yes stop_codon:yes gene_type:complete
MIEIATPISHLFDDKKQAERLIRCSDCLECRDRSIQAVFPDQCVFHTDIQLVHSFSDPDVRHLEQIALRKTVLQVISFHAATSCSDPVLNGRHYYPGGLECSRDELLKQANRNVNKVRSIFGDKVIIALENNNYYPTDAYHYITDASFLTEIVKDNGLKFLFDISHARITSLNRKMPYNDYVDELPVMQTIQLHLGNFGIDERGMAFDNHDLPPDAQQWIDVRSVIKSASELRYLTIEYYKDIDELENLLNNARDMINELPG